jgi:hypothetical protein
MPGAPVIAKVENNFLAALVFAPQARAAERADQSGEAQSFESRSSQRTRRIGYPANVSPLVLVVKLASWPKPQILKALSRL